MEAQHEAALAELRTRHEAALTQVRKSEMDAHRCTVQLVQQTADFKVEEKQRIFDRKADMAG